MHGQVAGASEHDFWGLRKNIIQYDDSYNPIVCPPGQKQTYHIYLVGSNCCYASFANTSIKKECNACIWPAPPAPTAATQHWVPGAPFSSFEHWWSVIGQPMVVLKLLRNVRQGEEILVHYDLPLGMERKSLSSGKRKREDSRYVSIL